MTQNSPAFDASKYILYNEPTQAAEGVTTATVGVAKTPQLSRNQYVRVDTITSQVLTSGAFPTNQTRLKVYRGNIGAQNLIATMLDARAGTIVQLNLILRPGDFLTFQWTNMDVGSLANGLAIGEQLQ